MAKTVLLASESTIRSIVNKEGAGLRIHNECCPAPYFLGIMSQTALCWDLYLRFLTQRFILHRNLGLQ